MTETAYPNGRPVNPATFTGNLLLAPAERADVIIDFTGLAGREFMLYNDAPAPFPGGAPTNDYYLGNPMNPVQPLAGTGPDTRNVVRFKVVPAAIPDPQPAGPILNPLNLDPQPLVPYTTTVAPIPPLAAPAGTFVRELTLNEVFDSYGRLVQMLGTTAPTANGFGIPYPDPATEIISAGTTEVWRLYNNTADTHPIHFHLINCQILSRQPFKLVMGAFALTGVARGPEPEEVGWKETIKMNPGEATTFIAKFDLPVGLPFTVPLSTRPGAEGHEYVYHCHILEHEEHDMMRPLVVVSELQITPSSQTLTGKTGGTVLYVIGDGKRPFTITSNNATFVPVATNNGFSVTVKNNTARAVVTFTVTDSSTPTPQTATATLNIV